jgi:hypothetical protein
MLYAGSDLNRALDVFTAGDQVSAAHTAYYSAADARSQAVADA